MKKIVYVYLVAIIVVSLHYFVIHMHWTDEWKVWVSIYVFSAAAVILDFWAVPIPLKNKENRILLSLDSSVYLASIFVSGIFPTLCILTIATITNLLIRRKEIWKVIINFNVYSLVLISSYHVFVLSGGEVGEPRFSRFLPYILAVFVYLITNLLLVGIYSKLFIGERFLTTILNMVKHYYMRYVVSVVSSITLSSLLYYHGIIGVILFVIFIMLIAISFNNYYELYQEQKNKAITDPLTGLYNHGYFHERLEEEVQRAKETGKPLCLLLLDLDDFKKYNDLFGHTKGDQYLKRFAELLRTHVRPTDMVFRYGGEEFAVILPQTDVETAYQMAQAMRKAINDTPFPGVEALPLGCISFSGGISTVTVETLDRYDLIKKADIALYYSKKQGKNQVHIYQDCLARVFITPDDAVKALIENLISVFQVKDPYTYQHSRRVYQYALQFGTYLGLDEREQRLLAYGALIHDIGKVEIPRSILAKKGKPTEDEWRLIQMHVIWGKEIITAYPSLQEFAPLVELHHERLDGRGYPYGLKGEQVPKLVRILTIIDSFDAMTTERPYQQTKTFDEAFAELKRCAGTQFDPYYVERFIAMMHETAISRYVPS